MKLLSHIKKDMEFNNGLYGLVEVLIAISISQYRVLEKKTRSFEKLFGVLESFFALIDVENSSHPLINTSGRAPGIIVVTSDSGLIGGLNVQAMNMAMKEARTTGAKLIVVGERGRLYAADSGMPFVSFKGVQDETRLFQAQQLRDYIMEQELSLKLGALKIIFPRAFSIVSQQVQTLSLLPFSKASLSSVKAASSGGMDMILESSPDDIAGYLVYLFLGHKFNEIFGFARLAELSARFVHLENSKTKIDQFNKQLKLQYFRQRHEMIDRNMREIFVARMTFNKG